MTYGAKNSATLWETSGDPEEVLLRAAVDGEGLVTEIVIDDSFAE